MVKVPSLISDSLMTSITDQLLIYVNEHLDRSIEPPRKTYLCQQVIVFTALINIIYNACIDGDERCSDLIGRCSIPGLFDPRTKNTVKYGTRDGNATSQ